MTEKVGDEEEETRKEKLELWSARTFDGKGFQGWRRSVLITLSAKNKIRFINGACLAPALTSRDYQPWSSLEHRFGQSNKAKLYHLRKELSSCLCVCEGKQKLEKALDDERLIQFLMGLNDSYGQARGTILMMNPLPSINHAYSLVLQDESQKEVFSNPLISPDSSSFMATNQNNFAQRSARQMQRNPMQHQKFGNNIQKVTHSTQRNTTFKGKKTKFNPNITCSHCKKVGHTVSDCYRIIGFPEDFEFTKLVQLIKQVKGADSGNSGTYINANVVAVAFSEEGTSFWAFELIHVDVWGPYKESTYNGFKYFLTVVDDYSRVVWTFFMSTKSNVFGLLKNFLTMVERQFGVKVQKIRTNNAFELGKGSQQAALHPGWQEAMEKELEAL
ncbi:uncharacterized protein LOC142173512 [Nicotiana tabacum]|uniref:Uncharacterized protein LOC142173512 n=1 Tax=Nicotiana tabacum TaxID=4097 RepID=A0AC58TDA7_TOBAC